MSSIQKRPDGKWRARYRDAAKKEHSRHFARKVDAQKWLDEVTASIITGTYVDPKTAKTTLGEWADDWLIGYGSRKSQTVRQARNHIKTIKAEFGARRLGSIRPSEVKAWTAKLGNTYAPSTVYAIYSRLAQIMNDAVHDGLIPKSPCSRRTSPGMGGKRPYVATSAQVWAIHDLFPEWLRPAVLLGAFAGLRVGEVVGLRVEDVDFMRGVITPAVQYRDSELKTDASANPIPIPQDLALTLSASVQRYGGKTIVTNSRKRGVSTDVIEAAFRKAKAAYEPDEAKGRDPLPAGFRFHDLRHFFVSSLIAAGLDVKTVQSLARHASAKTTLDTYGHMFPDKDESARAAIAAAFGSRADFLRTSVSEQASD